MTANQMNANFLLKLDIISNYSAPGLEDSEVSSFLSDAEHNIVNNILNPKDQNKLVDFNELVRKELNTLYINGTLTKSSDNNNAYNNGFFWTIPEDHYYTLNLSAKVSSEIECLDGEIITVKPITYDEYNTNIKNPFKQPGKQLVWVLQGSPLLDAERIQTIHASVFTDITNLYITYIKKLVGITVDTEVPTNQVNSSLPSILHIRIVDEAVELAKLQLGLLQEYQTQKVYNEENK